VEMVLCTVVLYPMHICWCNV